MEIWKDVVEYEGWYKISNFGRVKRVRSGTGTQNGFVLKRTKHTKYPMVILYKNGERRPYMVHLLVLEAFVGPKPTGWECNHIDGNKENAHVDNLEWVTRSYNQQHAYKLHPSYNTRGDKNGNTSLSTEDVLRIRELYPAIRSVQLGKMFNVNPQTIMNIINRKTWDHVP